MYERNGIKILRLEENFYGECINKVLSKFKGVEGIHSIYKFGSISTPGISDVDLLFVIEPREKVAERIFNVFETQFSAKEKYVVYQFHPLILTRDLCQELNIIRKTTDIVHLWGEKQKFPDLEDIYVKFSQLIDLLVHYYPGFLIIDNHIHDHRLGLQYINAFKYPLALYHDISEKFGLDNAPVKETEKVLSLNDSVKTNIFSYNVDSLNEYILDTNKKLFHISGSVKSHIKEFILEKNIISLNKTPKIKRIANRFFTNRFFQDTHAIKKITALKKKITIYYEPEQFFYFFKETDLLTEQFREATRKRHNVLANYMEFTKQILGGRNMYLSWWYRNWIDENIFLKSFCDLLYLVSR